MAELYLKRQWHYEALICVPENFDRIRELTDFDPVMLPAGVVIPYCVETETVEYPLCVDMTEFDERYELEEVNDG